MLKLITFDIGKTILNTSGKGKLRLIEEVIKVPKEVFKNDYKRIFCTSKKTLEEMIKEFCDLYKVEEIQKIRDIFIVKTEGVPNQDVEKLIKFCYNKGCKIATISNACVWTYNSIKNTSVTQFIDKEFYSFDMGYVKPNHNVFKIVEEYYKVSPNEILHIGDSEKSDYIAAKECGWNAFLLNNNIEDIYSFINILMREEDHREDC